MSQEQKKPRGFANAPSSQSETVKSGQTEVPSAKSALDKLEAADGMAKVIHGANDGVFKVGLVVPSIGPGLEIGVSIERRRS